MSTAAPDSARDLGAASLPTGEVAFLFSDVEGSTVRWDRHQSEMTEAMRRHDALMRKAIAGRGGVVFKTIGDAFCAVFSDDESAVLAALDAQRALAEEDFSAVDGMRVRMALHAGTSDERDGDYFGPTLNRVARLLATGHGGQVLLSARAAQSVERRLPADASLLDLGDHRLKDLSAPERVYQLRYPGLLADFPRLRSLSVLDNNLPQQLSSLVGRERDIAAIKDLLKGSPLVTLLGAGGIGKTRCALQAGAEVLESFTDGVWFVDMAPLGEAALVANAIAAVFEVRETASRPMLDSILDHFKGKSLLLILDNCEHLIAETSRIAAAIVRAHPSVKIIATSREHLAVQGEAVYRMPSLDVPAEAAHLSAEEARGFGAVALFNERAQAANPRFVLTNDNARVVTDICKRLDGIPLALELAAARLKVLSPRQLAQKLDERFRLLTGGDRTALPRQQTMRATIDWSYDLLGPGEQRLFAKLSIFAGEFALELIPPVCADEALDDLELFDLLASLVDKSLVNVEHTSDEQCYRLLESTRQYAREKLLESGELQGVAGRHAEAYAGLAEQLERDYETMPFDTWLCRAEANLENVRVALSWSLGEAQSPETGRRLAATLGRVFAGVAAVEMRRWVVTATEFDPPPTMLVRARLELAGAHLDSVLNQSVPALRAAQHALQLFESCGDLRGAAEAKRFAGHALIYLNRPGEAEPLLLEALATLRALGSRRVAGILRDLGAVRAAQEDICGAREMFADALAIFKRNADEPNVLTVAGYLAEAEFRCGDPPAAIAAAQEALAAARKLKRPRTIAWILNNLAAFFVASQQFELARESALEALAIARSLNWEIFALWALQHVAAAKILSGPVSDPLTDYQREAISILGFVDARYAACGFVREYTEEQEYARVRQALGAGLPAARVEAVLHDGALLNEDQAVAEALRL